MTTCPMLFPFIVRQLFFNSTAFGYSRSIHWIQNQHALNEHARLGEPRRVDPRQPNQTIGRLKSELVFVPRGPTVRSDVIVAGLVTS